MCVQLGMLAERIMLFLYVCVSVVVCCALMEVVVFLSFLLSACVTLTLSALILLLPDLHWR